MIRFNFRAISKSEWIFEGKLRLTFPLVRDKHDIEDISTVIISEITRRYKLKETPKLIIFHQIKEREKWTT